MAETATSTNNVSVKYRGKGEREMPSVSQKQNRFMHAVAEGKVKGVPKAVGKDFVAADRGRKIGNLPKRVGGPKHAARVRKRARSAAKRGLISEKAMKTHMGEVY